MSLYVCLPQEDLTPKEMDSIIDELKAGKVPKAGPRSDKLSP